MSIDAAELIKIGFSAKEAKLYLTLLARGGGTAAELTAASALQRPTVYSLLESLQEKGLVAKCLHGSRSFFTPEPPEQLMKNIETQKRNIDQLLPDLTAMFMANNLHPRVRYYDGIEGIRKLHEIFLSLPRGSNYYYFGSMRSSVDALGEDFVAEYTRQRVRNGIWSNGIYPREAAMTNPDLTGSAKNFRRLRYFDLKGMTNLGQLTLFDRKIAIFSGRRDLFGMILESEDCYTIMKMVFDAMWSMASPE